MGWFIRKSKSIGPGRINVSKSGIGFSTGFKGARLSFGPKGTYVNLGRGGIYYRKKIGGKERAATPVSYNSDVVNAEAYTDMIRVAKNRNTSSNIGDAIIHDINRARLLTLCLVIMTLLLYSKISAWSIVIALLVRLFFANYFQAKVEYELELESGAKWNTFLESLHALKSSKKVWMIESAQSIANRKVNAGAGRNITRSNAKVRIIKPRNIVSGYLKTNVPTALIKGKRCSLRFLPSDVIVRKGLIITAVSYEQLRVDASYTNFIEEGKVPKDTQIIRMTWQFVNKDGTADQRYGHNRQIPVCRYGVLNVYSKDKLAIEIHTSNPKVVSGASDTFSLFQRQLLSKETVKTNHVERNYQDKTKEHYDELVPEAAIFFLEQQKVKIGTLMEYLNIGFNRSARILDQLEELGLVSEECGTNPRSLLLTQSEWNEICKHFGWPSSHNN